MGTVIRAEVSCRNTYWISRHRYYELKHFCLQYPEWKEAYHNLDGFGARPIMEIGRKGGVSDPTYIYAQARIYYRDRMDMVEKAALDAVADMAKLMVKAVTEGLSYEHISPPCCKEVWYAGYRRFFWLLDKARK